MQNKKAEAGIGTLILFIALILVAAVAAGVLITTASSLQSKALFTGTKAQAQVSSQAVAISAYGKDASSGSPRVLDRAFVKVKLAPGSDPIKIDDATMQVDLNDDRASLIFSSALNCSIEDASANGLFNPTANPNNSTYFGVRWLIGGENPYYIQRGDVLEVCMAFPTTIGEGEDMRITFTPKIGHATVIQIKTPDVMLTQNVQLFP